MNRLCCERYYYAYAHLVTPSACPDMRPWYLDIKSPAMPETIHLQLKCCSPVHSSFLRPYQLAGHLRVCRQFEPSILVELPTRGTLAMPSRLCSHCLRISSRNSASWKLVWWLRFERRGIKRGLARKGVGGDHIWPLMSTLPNADCFAPSNRLPALPVATRTSPSFSCKRCCPPCRVMKSRQDRSWSASNTDSFSSTAKPSSWVRNLPLTSGLYLQSLSAVSQ